MPSRSEPSRRTRCCIAGGGPAGMMLGVLLARAGVDVLVLEKHADFLRDFRGDTVHPSTLQVMHELGWLEEFLKRPHQEVRELAGQIGGERVLIGDFTHLPTRCRFVVLMPQWHFLDFLAEQGRRYPSFHLEMEAEAIDLVRDGEQIVGVTAKTPRGTIEVRADLTIGADGRQSVVRTKAGLEILEIGAPIDVLWMRLSRQPGDPAQTLGHIRRGHLFVTLDRGDYWQCAFVIPKGGFEVLKKSGLQTLRETIAATVPFLRDRLGELSSWDDLKLLVVKIDRLKTWYRPGLLCIGDAAHAMSPVGGVGINLAIQDAVAAANTLVAPLRHGRVTTRDLRRVQQRRRWPTWATQRLQVLIQNALVSRVLQSRTDGTRLETEPIGLPLFARLLRDHPMLRRLPARFVGLGFRPEHVRSPEL